MAERKNGLEAGVDWLRWVLVSWGGRGMLCLLALLTVIVLLLTSENRRIAEISGSFGSSRQQSVAGDAADRALRSASHLVALNAAGKENAPEALAALARARAAVAELQTLSSKKVPRLAESVLAVLRSLEESLKEAGEAGGGPVAAGSLLEALEYQWNVLATTMRADAEDRVEAGLAELRSAAGRRGQWFGAMAILVALVFFWPLWMSWRSKEKLLLLSGQVLAGEYGRTSPVEAWDEHGELIERLNELSVKCKQWEERSFRERKQHEKDIRSLGLVLEAAAGGDCHREFHPETDGEWVRVAGAVNQLIGRVRKQAREEDERRRERRMSVSVSRESLAALERLVRLKDDDVDGALRTFTSDDPLREVAVAAAALVGGYQEMLEKLRVRLREFNRRSSSIIQTVSSREKELEKEYEFIHETSSTVDQVSIAARESSQMVEHVFKSSQNAMDSAETGRDLVIQSIDGMNAISNQVTTIAHNILGLSKKSQEIGNIVRAIGEVSKQTNLLALNAAIEAAGAGEHGKGFAVVAKEIRELAVRSSESTEVIEKLIQEMQNATNTAVLSTEEGSKSVQAGVRIINNLNENIDRILERFQEVVESAHQISTASQEQTVGAKQVSTSIASLDRTMQVSLRDLQKLRESLEGYSELAGEVENLVGSEAEGIAGAS